MADFVGYTGRMSASLLRSFQRTSVRTWAAIAVLALILVSAINLFVVEPFVVSGTSMEPTYGPGNYLGIDRLSTTQRGDVIVFHNPLEPSMYFIKRIDALPGETVNEQTGAIVPAPTDPQRALDATTSTLTLASDEYFVLGDNGSESFDSRTWGPLQKKFIVGRVLARLWPL